LAKIKATVEEIMVNKANQCHVTQEVTGSNPVPPTINRKR
jgi:hypothetical protein